jgi:hypothetical protein
MIVLTTFLLQVTASTRLYRGSGEVPYTISLSYEVLLIFVSHSMSHIVQSVINNYQDTCGRTI